MSSYLPSALELLRSAKVVVAPDTFSILSLQRSAWKSLLETQNTGPSMRIPFLIFMDSDEVTLVLAEADFANIPATYLGSKVARGYRLLTFDIVLDLSVIGFIAEVARILAEAGVSILPISAFSRDHLLIRQDELAGALKALGPYVDSVC